MLSPRRLPGIVFRTAAVSFLMAAQAALPQARQTWPVASTPFVTPSESAPAAFTPAASSSSSANFALADSDPAFSLRSAAPESFQPPPRRYGRPDSSGTNPDGSSKYTFFGGFGAALPVGNTHKYQTLSYGYQVGGGRNFNQNFGVLLQFDYDHFGLQAATINNQEAVYNYCPPAAVEAGQCAAPLTNLDGNNHVWSFTLNPAYTLATRGSLGAYAVAGGGFYHKVTNFLVPTTAEECSIYGCGYFNVDETVDHYTSNAFGVNGGVGLTVKPSEFSGARLYVEARYVLMLNAQRTGYTAQNVSTTTYAGYDAYPANSNRTTYIPIKVGIRF